MRDGGGRGSEIKGLASIRDGGGRLPHSSLATAPLDLERTRNTVCRGADTWFVHLRHWRR